MENFLQNSRTIDMNRSKSNIDLKLKGDDTKIWSKWIDFLRKSYQEGIKRSKVE